MIVRVVFFSFLWTPLSAFQLLGQEQTSTDAQQKPADVTGSAKAAQAEVINIYKKLSKHDPNRYTDDIAGIEAALAKLRHPATAKRQTDVSLLLRDKSANATKD